MRRVILYGELAKRFGKHHRFAVKNVAEAIRALRANFPGFEKFMCSAHNDQIGFRVFVGGSSIGKVDEIHDPSGMGDVIRIVPVIMGAGGSPWFRVILGTVLVAAAVVASVYGQGQVGAVLGSLGVSMIVGGVAQLLSPAPRARQTADHTQSYLFNGPTNTSAQGSPVPVGYGRLLVGSAVISAGIVTYDW